MGRVSRVWRVGIGVAASGENPRNIKTSAGDILVTKKYSRPAGVIMRLAKYSGLTSKRQLAGDMAVLNVFMLTIMPVMCQ